MKFTEKKAKQVQEIISNHRLVADRVNDLKNKGFTIDEKSMGSGGTGQIKTLRSEIRIQIGYGHGKNNYSQCVIFSS